MKRTIILSRGQWWKLKTLFMANGLTPDEEFDFENGDHINIWKDAIHREFNAKYYETPREHSKEYYGRLVFHKAKYMSWFLLQLSNITCHVDDDDYG